MKDLLVDVDFYMAIARASDQIWKSSMVGDGHQQILITGYTTNQCDSTGPLINRL